MNLRSFFACLVPGSLANPAGASHTKPPAPTSETIHVTRASKFLIWHDGRWRRLGCGISAKPIILED